MVSMLAAGGALLGLIVGSFLNVVAHRVPAGRSVVRPGSACPACGAPVRPRDNVPVVSWFVLRGRCRDCGVAISARYPLVESVTGVAFAAAALLLGSVWVLPAYWWFAGVGIALVLTDLDHKRLPDRIVFPGFGVGLVLLAAGTLLDGGGAGPLLRGVAGAAAYAGFLFVIFLIAPAGGFGFGDVKLALVLGLFLAYQSWAVLWAGIMLAFLIGGLTAVALLVTRRAGRKDAIPFGPALILGAFVAVAWGQELADWYLGL